MNQEPEKIEQEELDKMIDQVWMDFLSQASVMEIHQSLISSNWDGNSLLLDWIKNNPAVDKATILAAYWHSGPRWDKQFATRDEVPEWNIETFDFAEEIERKYLQGYWTSNVIAFDPANDEQGQDWTKEDLEIETVREIPEIMFLKLEGQRVEYPRSYFDGLPSVYDARIREIYSRYTT